jgi:hypothetical protein
VDEQIPKLDIFSADKWLDMPISARKKQLQQLENYYAEKLRRKAIRLQYDPRLEDSGLYNPNDNTILINPSVLNVTKADMEKLYAEGMEKNDLTDFKCYYSDFLWKRNQLIETVIHEGKHADQRNVLQKVRNHPNKYPDEKHPDLDQQKIQLWKENNVPGCYLYSDEKGDYINRYQAIEDDAWNFAKEEMDKIWSRQSLQEQLNYGIYRTAINTYDLESLEMAKEHYQRLNPDRIITDPRTEINVEVHQEYILERTENQRYYARIDLAEMSPSGDDTIVQNVQVGELRAVLNSHIGDISDQEMVVNGERDLVKGDPLTIPRAEELAASDYVLGEDKQLDQQENDLKIKREKLNEDEKTIINYGKENGLDKTIWRKAPEMFKGEGLKYYESSIATIENNKKFFEKLAAMILMKRGQLQGRLQSPEARLAIEKKSAEYLARDKERLAKLAQLNSKISMLKKEKSDLIALKNSLPSRKLRHELHIQGDARNVRNLLNQTDKIMHQVSAIEQTITRSSGQGISLQTLLK